MGTDKRYQIFVSSTYIDLVPERNAVIKAILDLGHIPVGMEMFSADNDEQWQTIKREIDRSDYYLIMVAHRYGSTVKGKGNIGYTEKEFDYAASAGIPRIGFLIADDVYWNPKWVDSGPLKIKVDKFKEKIKKRPVSFWTSPDDLTTKVTVALSKIIVNTPRPGWRRASDEDQQTIHTMNLLTQENMQLREDVKRLSELQVTKAELSCNFIDAQNNDLGKTIRIERPEIDLETQIYEKNRLEVQKLVDKYDEVVASQISGTQTLAHTVLANVDKHLMMPYDFDPKRSEKLRESLKEIDVKLPASPFKFPNLKYFQFDRMLGYGKVIQPSGGSDLQKYNAFREIESAIEEFNSKVREELFDLTHEIFDIRINNSGTIAIDDIKIEIKFDPPITGAYIGKSDFNEDLHSFHKLNREISAKVLVPGESLRVGRMIFSIPQDIDIVTCKLKIIGRQLPSPIESEFEIQFH